MEIIQLFTDLSINGGWNLCAIMFYAAGGLLTLNAITEKKENEQ